MAKKLLVSDYDGTFYSDLRNLKINIKAIEKFRKAGNLFAISTGRAYDSIKKECKKHNIPYDYLFCNDGAVLFNKDDGLIYAKEFPRELLVAVGLTITGEENVEEVTYYGSHGKVIVPKTMLGQSEIGPIVEIDARLKYFRDIKKYIECIRKTHPELEFSKVYNHVFIKEKEVDMIIIAGGTISSNIYEEIKDSYGIPIYDIINPICNYLENKCHDVLLLATSMTIRSKVFKSKLEEKNIKVYDKECPMFVPIIEGKNKEDINKYIEEYLIDYKNKNIDLIIPGCTHYPLISKELENYLNVKVLDIGYIIASSLDIKDSKKGLEIYFSKIDDSLLENVKRIIGDTEIKLKKL